MKVFRDRREAGRALAVMLAVSFLLCLAAALIVADKSDVHYSRVQNPIIETFDIHDRVNFSVQRSHLRVDTENKSINLELTTDEKSASVMEYFEIFLARMLISRRAADFLKCRFELVINGTRLV